MTLSLLAFIILAVLFAGGMVIHFLLARAWQQERERLYDRIQGPEASQWFQSLWAQKERQIKAKVERERPQTVEVDLGV